MESADLKEIGINSSPLEQATRLALLARIVDLMVLFVQPKKYKALGHDLAVNLN